MKLSDAKAQPLETYNFIGVHPVHTIYPEFLYAVAGDGDAAVAPRTQS